MNVRNPLAKNHICMRNGRKFYLDLPPEEMAKQFEIDDIAHSLAHLVRFNGHLYYPYSVLEHTLLMANYAEKECGKSPTEALTVLLHDASESVIGDIATPIKDMFPEIKEYENLLDEAIAIRYGTIYPFPSWLKDLDNGIRGDEIRAFSDTKTSLRGLNINFMPLFGSDIEAMKKLWLGEFHRLYELHINEGEKNRAA